MIETTIKNVRETAGIVQDHYLYLVRDEEVILYVGQSIDPVGRLHEHLGMSWRNSDSDLGQIVSRNAPASDDWQVELRTLSDCEALVQQYILPHLSFYRLEMYRDPASLPGAIDFAEQALIDHYHPCLNVTGNESPHPLPDKYQNGPFADLSGFHLDIHLDFDKDISWKEGLPDSIAPEDILIVREWLSLKRSRHTKRAYGRAIGIFYLAQGSSPLAQVKLSNLQEYAKALGSRYQEKATQAQLLSAVKSLFAFAFKVGYLPVNPAMMLQLPQVENKLAGRLLSDEQVQSIIYEAKKSGEQRNLLITILLYTSGIRCEEVCNLQWKHVQATMQGGQITVVGKRGRTRSIALHPQVWQALNTFRPEQCDPQIYVFQSRRTTIRDGLPSRRLDTSQVWRIISSLAARAGIKASPHFLRHSHATSALEKKVSIRVIQETLGHTTLAATVKYTHVRPGESSSLYLDIDI